ncbi:hypothetical protein F0562_001814 [Nyssa sinensis]|uniref:DUF659 domain-containing protein n=1 Tax=Nyssa sinensis TaxID=561372 RepID=A0A5J5C823_9ASTE|nr:hypothetical protein F0562_001814 [Nyssa sinensis]
MIDEIALAGVGLKGPTPYEIGGLLLDDEIEELQEYIEQFKKKFETYGVTIMCDGWSSITRQSIINFLVYCDGNIVFHRSVNTSSYDKDANYIFQLMDQVVEEIGERYVVQMITDNHAAYKKAAVHNILDEAKKVTNFIYNHNRILDIMRNYCTGELIRPGQTRFATNYIALQSILDQKSGLQIMFSSEDWSKSATSRDPAGKKVHTSILNPKFWERTKKIVAIHAPIAKVIRMVDGEKKATMPYVYEVMKRAKKAVKEIAPKSCKKYLDIVDARWKKIIIQPIHMAAYYLNPAYHYEEDARVKDSLLGSLKVIISRLETNPNRASQALAEVKIFREAMYGFAEQTAIRGRTRTDLDQVKVKVLCFHIIQGQNQVEEGKPLSLSSDDDDEDDDGDDGDDNNNEEDSDSDDDDGTGDAIMRGMDMINRGLSSMSMSESEHDRRGGSSSSYGCGSGYDQPYGYEPRGYNLHTHGYGSSTYGYGSGYDSQASSSHGYGPAPAQREGWIPAPTSQQLGCSVTEYERF